MVILTEKQIFLTSRELGLVTLLRNMMGDEIGMLGSAAFTSDRPVDLIAHALPEQVGGHAVYDVQCLTQDAFAFVDLQENIVPACLPKHNFDVRKAA